eukprot:1157812-Pelagomonas_calceolata.AAC.7
MACAHNLDANIQNTHTNTHIHTHELWHHQHGKKLNTTWRLSVVHACFPQHGTSLSHLLVAAAQEFDAIVRPSPRPSPILCSTHRLQAASQSKTPWAQLITACNVLAIKSTVAFRGTIAIRGTIVTKGTIAIRGTIFIRGTIAPLPHFKRRHHGLSACRPATSPKAVCFRLIGVNAGRPGIVDECGTV